MELIGNSSRSRLGYHQRDEHIIIAVIDTGVNLDHPDMRRRITNGYNVLLNNNFPDDDNGHGTHGAGSINVKLIMYSFDCLRMYNLILFFI
ncbi:S8 family serine peptidase [Gracilibacillus sp. JCM 18860]|uniref:S8 family serine peptidase n=1 Tax=Gracilibacillus sp. JCM 18860 TaxID=1306159 RepID=UPI00326129CD